MALILVGGGARSGKSRHALSLAKARGPRLGFLATGVAFDDEMRERIARHREERGNSFTTIEEPYAITAALQREQQNFDAIIVDCLTIWLSNLILAERYDPAEESKAFVAKAASSSAAVIAVTNEVGCGIVPENALARRFRDEAGWLNQRVAEAASEVYWMAFGCPLRVK